MGWVALTLVRQAEATVADALVAVKSASGRESRIPSVGYLASPQELASVTNTLLKLGVPGIAGTLLGTTLGAWLSSRTARTSREESRQDALDLLVDQQERAAMTRLDDQLVELSRALWDQTKRNEALKMFLNEANQYSDFLPVRNGELRRRLRVLLTFGLTVWAWPDAETFPTYALGEAIDDVRKVITALLTRAPVPEPAFPDAFELREALHEMPHDNPFGRLNARLAGIRDTQASD